VRSSSSDGQGLPARPLTRRRLIGDGMRAASVVAVPRLWAGGVDGLSASALASAARQRGLRQPRVLRSRQGKLRARLICRPAVVDMGAPRSVRTYTYTASCRGTRGSSKPAMCSRSIFIEGPRPRVPHPLSTPSRSLRSTAGGCRNLCGGIRSSSQSASGDSLTFETNFDDFTGKFVEHCHVVAHEDLGMMSAVEVVP
jgi:hypothetical protein